MYSFQVIVNIERKELHVDFFFCVLAVVPSQIWFCQLTKKTNKQLERGRFFMFQHSLWNEINQSIHSTGFHRIRLERKKKNQQTKKKKRKKKKNGPFFFLSFLFYFYLWFSGIFWYPDTLRRECTGFFLQKKRKDEKISMSICLLANNSTLSSSVLSVGCCFFFWVSALFFCFRSEATGSSCRGLFWSFSYLYFSIRLVSNTALVFSRFFSQKKH